MSYYRKAAAVFILVLTLLLPLFLEVEKETAVVNLQKVTEESSYLSQILEENGTQIETDSEKNIEEMEREIKQIIKSEAAELAAENNYSSIIIKQPVYKGGKDISSELAEKIDEQN